LSSGQSVEKQDSTNDQDQHDQYQTEVVKQAQALILHNRAMIADQQDGGD
jgi:hypothetical protein